MLLGAVVRDFSDPFFAWALEALAVEAIARGYNLILGHVQGREQEGLALPAVLEPRRCDAVIMLGEIEDQPQLLADLLDAKAPVVALWQGRSPIRFPTVDVDDRKGIAIGLEHLVQLGHERIGFVSARLPGDNPTREEAFIDFMVSRFGACLTATSSAARTRSPAERRGSRRCSASRNRRPPSPARPT